MRSTVYNQDIKSSGISAIRSARPTSGKNTVLGENGETVVGLESRSFPYVFEDDRRVFTGFRLVD